MEIFADERLRILADVLEKPLYIVGGYVRNYLIDGTVSRDVDIAAALPAEKFCAAAEKCGFSVKCVHKNTSTAVAESGGLRCEYTSFRKDIYEKGGAHTPVAVIPTDSIEEDAARRDFKCNAVYYDIKNDKTEDVLGGIRDISEKVLDTVVEPSGVFCADGLRLMRLARFAGELGFRPTADVLAAAQSNAALIKDIAAERVFDELKKTLVADTKYAFSPADGHYAGLKILSETGVLDYIIPELTAGRNMPQRADFHRYDVLEHTFRTVLYALPKIRLAALFHDVGKPFCMINYGKFKGHDKAGAEIAREVLSRLKADGKTVREIVFLTGAHMKDLAGDMRAAKIRVFMAENSEFTEDLLALKQADYRAGKDATGTSPTVKKWLDILNEMKKEGAPFRVKDLKISARELENMGFKGKRLGEELKVLFRAAVAEPYLNDSARLKALAEKDFVRLMETEN